MIRQPNSNIIIICEAASTDPSYTIINESGVGDISTVTIEAVLQTFDVMNWNRRIYESGLVMNAIDSDPNIQYDLSQGTWYGEYSHPLSDQIKRQMTVVTGNASHCILKYWQEGNKLMAHVETLAQSVGRDMRDMILSRKPAMFSLRALGSVDPRTKKAVAPLKVITYDAVIRPSHKDAYQTKIITNPRELAMNESTIYSINESALPDQIFDFVKDKSDNLKFACDFFDLTYEYASISESCDHVILRSSDNSIKLLVPIENAINMQYRDLIKL